MMDTNNIDELRAVDLEGRRIKLIMMHGDPHPIEPDSLGTVTHLDDGGILHIKWDNGRSLGLIIGIDEFEFVYN